MKTPKVGSVWDQNIKPPHERYDATKVGLTQNHLRAIEYAVDGLKEAFQDEVNLDHLLSALKRSFETPRVKNPSGEVNILKAALLLRVAAEGLAPNPEAIKFLEFSDSEEKLS